MQLKDIDFLKLMPTFMQSDETVVALCKAVDDIFSQTADDIEKLSDWDRIDSMSESELDYLAWECNITWYDKTTDIATKRSLCKNSDKIFMTRATVSAVEEVVSTYFSDAKLKEFFDYNGQPHHFKVECTDVGSYTDKLALFLDVLEKTKRKSQWLEALILLLKGSGNVYSGMGLVEKASCSFNCTEGFASV